MKKISYYFSWALLVLCSTAIVIETFHLWQNHQSNTLITRIQQGNISSAETIASDNPAIQLAYASYLKKHKRFDEALLELGKVVESQSKSFSQISRYNLANLYLTQAIEATEEMKFDQAIALTELAKNAYRHVLANNSQFWDAKYNLEVAMRLLPEMDRINLQDEQVPPKKSKPWTTIPGFPRGLP